MEGMSSPGGLKENSRLKITIFNFELRDLTFAPPHKAKQRMATAAPLLLDHVINPNHDALGHSAVFSGSQGNLFCVHCASDRLSAFRWCCPTEIIFRTFLPSDPRVRPLGRLLPKEITVRQTQRSAGNWEAPVTPLLLWEEKG